MNDIFAKRLKSARIRAGISQDQLVKNMGGLVSKNAISKYEKGKMMAGSKVLLALAKALDVKPDYFFRPFTVEISQIEFRKKSKLSVKAVNAIRQKVTDFIERYVEVEQFLNIHSDFSSPVTEFSISSKQDVEQAANIVRNAWDLGSNALPNVIDMLEDKQIKIIEIDAPDEFDGFSGWANGNIPLIIINKNYTIERKRLTALHELGHLLLNLPDKTSHKDREHFCFQFAGAMLIPDTTFKNEIGEHRSQLSEPELIAMKETYGISIQAIMARAKDLDIITDLHYISFRKWISHNRKEIGMGTYRGIEQSFRFKQLIYRAAAEEVISLSKAANLSNQKLAEFRKEFVAL